MKHTLIFTCLLSLAMSGMVLAGEQAEEQKKQQAGKSSQKTFQSSETFLEGQAGPEYGKEQEERAKQSQEKSGQQQQESQEEEKGETF